MVRTKGGVLPIEVKFKASLRKADFSNLFDFMRRNDLERGILISRNKVDMVEKDNLKVLVLPAWFV